MGEEVITGSEELRGALPRGVLKQMSEVFGFEGQTRVGRIVSGKDNGNPLIVECAERIAIAYEDCGFDEALEVILKDYEGTNK